MEETDRERKCAGNILTILVADDDHDDCFILQRAFKEAGLAHPVHLVHDGQQAIEYLHGDGIYADRAVHPFPDVLILDLKMPRVSGFEVLEWIDEHPDFRVIPAIVWSASADRRDVKHAYCLGAHAYLCKPTRYGDFLREVRHLLAFWGTCEKYGVEPIDRPSCETLRDTHPFAGARFG